MSVRRYDFPLCCGAKIFAGFSNIPTPTPEEAEKILLKDLATNAFLGALPTGAFDLSILTEGQYKINWPTMKKLGFRVVAKGLNANHDYHKLFLLVRTRPFSKEQIKNMQKVRLSKLRVACKLKRTQKAKQVAMAYKPDEVLNGPGVIPSR